MRSLKLEQVAVIKFLTLEGSSKSEIFLRLKNVFSSFTLPKEKIHKLHLRFLKEGLLGLKDSVYENDFIAGIQNSSDVKIEAYCDDDTEINGCLFVPERRKKRRKHGSLEDDMEFSKTEDENSHSIKLKNKDTEDSQDWINYKSNDDYNSETNDFEIYNSSIKEDESNEDISENEEESEFDSLNDTDAAIKLLPIIPLLNTADSLTLLDGMHSGLDCLLCVKRSFPFRSHLKLHLATHIKHSTILNDSRSLLCKKNCSASSKGHYHCSLCTMVSPHASRVYHHFTKFHIDVVKIHDDIGASEMCTCVDVKEGIFLVRKSKYGLAEPIHVQKLGKNIRRCSQEMCQNSMEVAKLNGNNDLECKHLRNVKLKHKYQPHFYALDEKSLRELHLHESEIDDCLSLSQSATRKGSPLIVEWVASDDFVYFSVFCSDSFAVMNRTLIIFHTKENEFVCGCPQLSSHFCVFKTISEVYYKNRYIDN